MISDKIIKVLEFDKVKCACGEFCAQPGSRQALQQERPQQGLENCRRHMAFTREADLMLTDYNVNPIYAHEDGESALQKATKLSMLTIAEILKVGTVLRSSRIFRTSIEQLETHRLPMLKQLASRIYRDEWLEKEIARCFVSDEIVSDTATDKLHFIRKKIRDAGEDIKQRLRSIVRGAEYRQYMQDAIVTVRSGRYVIPVKQEYKSSVAGMLHDRSDSGSTVYIEPAAVVELNNEIRLLQIAERQEIEAILKDFTARISAVAETLLYNIQNLCDADIAFAKARYAHHTKAMCPVIAGTGNVNIVNGRHPLIDPQKVVPVSVAFGKDYNILIITGPNTGGKTVTLKLCGLFTLMAMSGMYLPAGDGTEVSVFSGIFADIGDEQSIEQSLSTFSSHIKNIVDITQNLTDNSLVLLDELGVGTDPAEGSALALAVLEYLGKTDCKGIVTSHYSEVKEYAFASPALKNASMEFDPVRLTPTYRLNIGMPGSSSALEISKKLGLKQEIIDRAYSYISKEKLSFDKILKSAEAARAQANIALEEVEQLKNGLVLKARETDEERERYQKLRQTLEKTSRQQLKKAYADAAYRSEELLSQLNQIVTSSELAEYDIVRAKQIKNQLADEYYKFMSEEDSYDQLSSKRTAAHALKEGDSVWVQTLGLNGTIVKLEKGGKSALVSVGGAQLSVPCAKLYQPDARHSQKDKKDSRKGVVAVTNVSASAPENAMGEIKLLGKTVLEAESLLDGFLDNCAISGIKDCRIIHGVGTGALRNGVREYLKTHPLVKSFRGGRYGEGEAGVTVVQLH